MYFSLITENYFTSRVSFTCVDGREFFYSTNFYHPTTSNNSIVWKDFEGGKVTQVGPIADNGDLSVNSQFAQKLMSFDPYAVEVYPSKLELEDGVVENRYLLAINNIIDVLDYEKSDIEISPRSGKQIVHILYLSEKKLKKIPLEQRVAFRVKGVETAMFFCEEFFNIIDSDSRFNSLRKEKIDINNRAPKF
ncbi:imm11 family protein [Aliivibrio logei]|uniref:Immunity MXAN-0049 protein domain-containing protein n=1 Tax=Aliivibrio logei TaxID=688 RepID=A0A1B9NW91_ALILO|nr:DUF1629 domain-containing protein [Aliivibrio logei]OCH19490.1 hypothetical protein A6E04_15785 [Aliivibrio logei]